MHRIKKQCFIDDHRLESISIDKFMYLDIKWLLIIQLIALKGLGNNP